jgi:putative spermidine/putrescine transport system substrate-binding protein
MTSLNPSDIIPDVRKNSLMLPPKDILDKSEFIYPISAASKAQYDRQWQEIRQIKVAAS